MDLERFAPWKSMAGDTWSWIAEYTSENKLTASLIATNTALITWYILWKTSRRRRLIDQIPGIKDYPLVGDTLSISPDPCVWYDQMLEIVNKNRHHGILKLKILESPWIILFTPEGVETLLGSNDLITKSYEYSYLHRWLGMGLLNTTGETWRKQRKMLTPSFHFKILQDFLHIMNEAAHNLVDKLQREACDTDKEYDIFQDLTLSSLDIICTTSMGVFIDALNNADSEYITAVEQIKDVIGQRLRNPLYWYESMFSKTPTGRKTNALIDKTHEFTHKVIKERREQFEAGDYKSGKYRPLLDSLLQFRDEETGQGLSDEEIRAEVDTFMFEGHDTTSSGMAFATHLLGAHPDAQKRCQEELDDIMGGRREITHADLSKMTYLEWCIKESMRLFPPVPLYIRSLTKETEFAGYTVPTGVSVYVFAWCLHYDSNLYPDPYKFDPTRFTPEMCHNRHPYAYVPFSAGPRNCVGQKYAMMELKVIIANLLLHFNIKSTQAREQLQPNPGMVLQPINGIKVKLISRSN